MEHLSEAELHDYARGLSRDANQHLTECTECGNVLSFLRKVAESAGSVEVPEDVVEEAKNIFPGGSQPIQHSGVKEVLARLVFLQTGGQQLVDVRSIQRAARQAVYRHGDYCIDLRVEAEPDSIKTSVVGQIVNQRKPTIPVSDVSVRLMAGNRTLQRQTCNGLGEFVIDFVSNPRLRLRFDLIGNGLLIDVPLKDLSNED